MEYPTWLDKDLMEKALRAGYEDNSIAVESCNISVANSAGDGYSSDMYRVVVILQDTQERRVVVKCQPQGKSTEKLSKKWRLFERETRMFTDTLPAMQQLLEKYPPIAAKCLYHGNHPVPYLVLEDLRHIEFTLTDKVMDLSHCSLAIRTLARFNATSLLLNCRDFEEPVYNEDSREDIAPLFEDVLHSLENIVLTWPGFERYSENIKNLRENVYDILMKSLRAQPEELTTLNHGDVWSRNMMFRENHSKEMEIRLLDFQACYWSSPALDVLHFLSTCPNEEVRDTSTENLIQEYHSTFTHVLEELGYSNCGMTLEDLKRKMDERIIYSFIITGVYLALTIIDTSKDFEVDDMLGQRNSMKPYWERAMRLPVYEKSIKKLLVKCESLGVL